MFHFLRGAITSTGGYLVVCILVKDFVLPVGIRYSQTKAYLSVGSWFKAANTWHSKRSKALCIRGWLFVAVARISFNLKVLSCYQSVLGQLIPTVYIMVILWQKKYASRGLTMIVFQSGFRLAVKD